MKKLSFLTISALLLLLTACSTIPTWQECSTKVNEARNTCYTQVANKNPNTVAYYIAKAYLEQDPQKIIDLANKGLDLATTSQEKFALYDNRAWAEDVLSESDTAITDAHKMLTFASTNDGKAKAYEYLSLAYSEKDQFEKSIKLAQKAVALAQDRPVKFYAYITLAYAYQQSHQYNEVIPVANELLNYADDTNDQANAYQYLSYANLHLNRADQAIEAAKAGLAIEHKKIGDQLNARVESLYSNLLVGYKLSGSPASLQAAKELGQKLIKMDLKNQHLKNYITSFLEK